LQTEDKNARPATIDPRARIRSPKGILFDAGGTLFDLRKSVGWHYSHYAREFGVAVDAETLNRRFAVAFQHAAPLAFPMADGQDLIAQEQAWWRALLQAVFAPYSIADFDRFFGEVYASFSRPDAWALFPETHPTLTRLRQQGQVLGIVSNFDSRLLPICEGLGIASFFKTITFSSHAGVAKPSPEIFKIALRQMGLHATDVVYVGDSPRHDLDGPRHLGMTALLLDRAGRHAHLNATRIPDLSHVLGHLSLPPHKTDLPEADLPGSP